MKEPTEDQRTLYKKLREIVKDDNLLMAIMVFAMNSETERGFIEAIDAGELTGDEDFYHLFLLIAEDNLEDEV